MKKILSVAAGAAIIACACLSFTACGGSAKVEYELSEDGEYYIVSGVSGNTSALKTYDVPETYEGKPVTQIADEAFYGCSSLYQVTIPDSITYIGKLAFAFCCFDTFVIPDSVTEIGYGAFGMCRSLREITIPESVTSLGARAFYACSSLKSVYLKANIENLAEQVFYNSVVESAGNVYYASSLTDIYLSSNIKKIHNSALYGNTIENIYYEGSEEEWNEVYFYKWEQVDDSEEYEESKVENSSVLPSGTKITYNYSFTNEE
jgi:hypothetical protein